MPTSKRKRRATPAQRSIGGANNEIGGLFRATVAAWVAAHGLVGRPLPMFSDLGAAVPSIIHLETDAELDDIGVVFVDGREIQLQAKHGLTLASTSRPMLGAIKQWRAALWNLALDPKKNRLVLATADASRGIRALASALDHRKEVHPGIATQAQRTYRPYQRLVAAWLITALEPENANARVDGWKDDPDPILRRVLAMTVAGGRLAFTE